MASVTLRRLKSGEEVYEIRVYRGRNPITGRQITPYSERFRAVGTLTPHDALRLARREAEQFEARCLMGKVQTRAERRAKLIEVHGAHTRGITFREFAAEMVNRVRDTLKPGTIRNYEEVLRRACKSFGETPLIDLTAETVKAHLQGLVRADGEPLAAGTRNMHYALLHHIFEEAQREGRIAKSPMGNMKRCRPAPERRRKALEADEARRCVNALEHSPEEWRALGLLMLDSGCRRGEAVGLRWEDVHFDTGMVEFRRNAQYDSQRGTYISTLKNDRTRSVYLNKAAMDALMAWKCVQAEKATRLGWRNEGFCFTGRSGALMNPQSVTAFMHRLGEQVGIERLHPHMFRHTMATLSIANGADVVSVSAKLGHAKPSVTLNIYSHANAEAQMRANRALSAALYANKDHSRLI